MRRFLIGVVLALTLSACGGGSLLPSIQNPLTGNNAYQAHIAYTATLQLADDYRTYCYKKPYKQILLDPAMRLVCQNRRTVIRNIQKYQPPAGEAVAFAEDFVANNPTISPITAVSAAWKAVTQFQGVLPARSAVPVGG